MANRGHPFPWMMGTAFLFHVTSANYTSQSEGKHEGASQIFALWLILMYVDVCSNFQVYPELVPTGRK